MRAIALLLLLTSFGASASEVDYKNKRINIRIAYAATSPERALANLDYVHSKTSKEPNPQQPAASDPDAYMRIKLQLGEIRGFTTHFDLVSLPKRAAARREVLKGIDAVIFVADGEAKRAPWNATAFKVLKRDLEGAGLNVTTLPILVQYEQKGPPGDTAVHKAALGLTDQKEFTADAKAGVGVFETLKAAAKLTLMALRDEQSPNTTTGVRAAPADQKQGGQ